MQTECTILKKQKVYLILGTAEIICLFLEAEYGLM